MVKRKIWATTLVLLLSAFICDSKTDGPCPRKCKCRFSEKSAKCTGLQMVPKLPQYVNKVLFIGANFTTVSDALLFNLKQNTIKSLDFIATNTVNVEPDAFSSFLNLSHLSFDSNRKLNPGVLHAFLNQTPNLLEINLESNGWNSIPNFMFAGLQNSLLKKISLKNNNIKYLSASFFSDVYSLEQLDLSKNDLTEFNTTGFESTNIMTLNIGFNHLLHIPSFCGPLGTETGIYKSLDLTSNPVYSLSKSSFSCLKYLRSLILDEISIRELKNNTFADLTSLRSLKMNSNGVHIKRIEHSAFNSSSLRQLSFGANRFRFDKQNNSVLSMFSYCPQLVSLDLNGNVLPSNSKALRYLFSRLKKLQTLILQSTHLKALPKNVFQLMPKLNKLVLIGNYISGWGDDPKVFGNVTSIRNLYLDGNNIKLINKTSFPPNFLNSLDKLCLTNNPFSCTCDLKWFLDWLKSTKHTTIVNYPNRYVCRSPPRLNNVLLKDYSPTDEMCADIGRILQNACIGISVTFIFLVLMASIMFRYRFHLRYWLHVTGLHQLGYQTLVNDFDYKYDAYVIYSDGDQSFIKNRLIPELETKSQCRLCIRARDFEAGALIVENITGKFELSKNIVVVLSRSLLECEWCDYQLALTQTKAVREGPGVLSIILLEDLDLINISPSLRALLSLVNCCTWSSDRANQRRFWGQLLTALNKHTDSENGQ